MSREPSSGQQRYAQAHGGWDSPQPPKPVEPTPRPVRPKKPRFKVVVPPAKPKPPAPARGYYTRARQEQAVNKLVSTTERLTADELQLLREMRAVNPDAARQALNKIRAAKAAKKENR